MINVLRANEVEFEEVKWLWRPYIPYGMVTTIVGDPGAGKTWIACKLAADLSRGLPLPDARAGFPPQKVLFASADDSVVHTLGPRMRDLGADLSRIFFVEEKVDLDKRGLIEFGKIVQDYAVTFVIIDPVVGFFGGDKSMNEGVDVRQVMGGLKVIAEQTGAAVVCIRHKRKASGKDAGSPHIYDGAGNIDFVGTARSEFHVRAGNERGIAVLDHVKSNIGPLGSSLAYSFGSEETPKGEHHHFEWLNFVPDTEKHGAQTEAAMAFIRDILSAGPVPAKVVYDRAKEAGIAERTLKAAKRGIAESVKTGADGGWIWQLT